MVNRARDDVLRLNTSYAVDATASDEQIDDSLRAAEATRGHLRRMFDAMSDLAGFPPTPAVGGQLLRLVIRVVEIAPAATAASVPFRELKGYVANLSIPPPIYPPGSLHP